MASFFLLFPVMPRYAAESGAGEAGAGAVTGALLTTTVVAELLAPRLVARFGHRLVFGTGLLLLGTPVLALVNGAEPVVIVLVSAVRGLGFGIVVVLGSALVALLVPAGRRGEGLGLYGLAAGAAGVTGMPAGVFVAERFGFAPVLIAGALAAIAGVLAVAGLPGRAPGATSTADGARPAGPVAVTPDTAMADTAMAGAAGLRTAGLVRPTLIFATGAMAAGVLITFLPLAVTGAAGGVVALALLAQATVAMVCRWGAGWYADRAAPGRLILPGLAVAAAGVLSLALVGNPVAVIAGAALFGAGFGTCQSAVLVLMFQRVPRARYNTVSALWNVSYDSGMGLGAVGFGVLVTGVGYPLGFVLLAGLVLLTLPAAWCERRAAALVSQPGG